MSRDTRRALTSLWAFADDDNDDDCDDDDDDAAFVCLLACQSKTGSHVAQNRATVLRCEIINHGCEPREFVVEKLSHLGNTHEASVV